MWRPEGWDDTKRESGAQQMFFTKQEDRCFEAGVRGGVKDNS